MIRASPDAEVRRAFGPRAWCQREVEVSEGAVVAAGLHAAVLENASRIGRGRGRCGLVSRAALCRRGRSVLRASRAFRMDSLCGVYCSLQKQWSSFCLLMMSSFAR